ncbi:snRNA-activating protein complex subunit-like isoform X1 [Durio zibethinus]|uniref:snRNA-activating protein complex subunit-like isoform X1 n=1 Tax=Durio zibethinus TaxID=66656 RepID=A0A6P6BEX7_DURZI|nr:snRNA-activating protein complex subunit-like isoform X1 [Durio zibethinus]
MESTNGSPCDTDLEGDAMEKKNGLKKRKIRKANNCLVDVKSWDVKEHIAVLYPDVVVCVEVYHNIRKWSKIQEFLVLGHQTLSEPKNKMYCLTDQLMLKAGLHDPSGYFLIEDMFLND